MISLQWSVLKKPTTGSLQQKEGEFLTKPRSNTSSRQLTPVKISPTLLTKDKIILPLIFIWIGVESLLQKRHNSVLDSLTLSQDFTSQVVMFSMFGWKRMISSNLSMFHARVCIEVLLVAINYTFFQNYFRFPDGQCCWNKFNLEPYFLIRNNYMLLWFKVLR